MNKSLSRLLTTTALGAPIALGAVFAHANSDIGKVAAVNPSMDGTPPAANARRLSLGAGVLQNERIETSEDGSGQLLFLDQTSLSIAPRSDIVLDKYVYDADQQTGEVAVTLTKGVLRLIGGRITKRTDGIIRTPTATIGVRGGLALVIVDPDGQTRVCHVAGEYTKVDSIAGGQVVLSRPNACAVVAAGVQPVFEGLIESEELAEIYRQIEGKGDGGRTIAADTIDTADVSGVNSGQKRGPNDTPVSTSGHSFVPEEGSLDEDQDRQDDGVQVLVVQVPPQEDNPAAPPPPPPPPPTSGPFVTGLAGGTVINQDGDGAAASTFVQVLQGSLIGETLDGQELRIPVPDTDGVSDASFDTANIIASNVPATASFTATDLAGSSGLFEFFLGDEEFDFDTGDQIAGSTSSALGDIRGVGFTDQAEQFTYVEFTNVDEDDVGFESSTGYAVFGNPTFGQSQFAEGDATISIAVSANVDTGTSNVVFFPKEFFEAEINPSLLNDTLVNGVANTVEGFLIQPNQFLHTVREDAPRLGETPFFMIGNQGFARYGRSDTFINAGSDILGGDLVGGGKWMNGALHISDAGSTGLQESQFYVFADDIKSFDGSGPIVSGQSFFSSFEEFDDVEIGLTPTFSFGSHNLGTLEDQEGNTIFGEENRYAVVSNVHREGLSLGDSTPSQFSNDAGSTTQLARFDFGRGTGAFYDLSTRDNGDFNSLLARDESLDQTITNPLPLASARQEVTTFYDTPNSVRKIDVLDRGFAAGMAVCQTGQCGDVDSFTTRVSGLDNEITEFGAAYAVRTGAEDNFSIAFDGRELEIPNDPFSEDATLRFNSGNSVDVAFSVSTSGAGNVLGARDNDERPNSVTYEFAAGGATSAYIDDNRFAATGESIQSFSDGASETQDVSMSLALASTGPVGPGVADDERFIGISNLVFSEFTSTESTATQEVDAERLNPEFARWGWWSAELRDVPTNSDSGVETRTDIVHLGNWVAGARVDRFLDDIPFAGIAAYDGLAVGTMTDLDTFDRRIVGGSFTMTYDFGLRSGDFNLNIPDANINHTIGINGRGLDTFAGRNADNAISRVTAVDGAFLANPGAAGLLSTGLRDGVAGVAGSFESTDTLNQVQTTGVFAGDRSSFVPPIREGITGPDTVTGGGNLPPTTGVSVPGTGIGGD